MTCSAGWTVMSARRSAWAARRRGRYLHVGRAAPGALALRERHAERALAASGAVGKRRALDEGQAGTATATATTTAHHGSTECTETARTARLVRRCGFFKWGGGTLTQSIRTCEVLLRSIPCGL